MNMMNIGEVLARFAAIDSIDSAREAGEAIRFHASHLAMTSEARAKWDSRAHWFFALMEGAGLVQLEPMQEGSCETFVDIALTPAGAELAGAMADAVRGAV